MLHLLIGTDWTANRQEVLNRIARDVRQRKPGRILMVPELISHEMERALCACAGDTASRYAEVLSFTRLARRAAEYVGAAAPACLDNGGRVVAMAAAARQSVGKLKSYASVETKPEFLMELVDAVDEFKRCCIRSEDLKAASAEAEGILAQKLEELAILMESYDTLCSRGRRDPQDQMNWLLEWLEEGNFAQEHVFYIDGFPDFTRQHAAILEHFLLASPEVTVSLNCDAPESDRMAFEKAGQTASQILSAARRLGVPVEIEQIAPRVDSLKPVRDHLFQGGIVPASAAACLQVYRAGTPWDEVMSAGRNIRELVYSGARYRDITVVCSDMSRYQPLVSLIFGRLGIPVYQSGTEDILRKSMISTVLMAMDAALSDFDQRNVLRYLRSALSGMDQDACDRLENYAIIWGIRGSRWTRDWEFHPGGLVDEWKQSDHWALEALNADRRTFITPLVQLREGFQRARSLREQVEALYAFLRTINLERRMRELAEEMDREGNNRDAQILYQLWEILLSALEQMYDVLGETKWEPEQFTRLLRLLLSRYDVGTIPPVLDAVQVGPVSAMRCHTQPHLFVLGAEDGHLPGYSGTIGVLTEQERTALRALGVPLTGGAMESVQTEYAEIYGVFCGAEQSIRVWWSGKQPSFVSRRLAELAGEERTADSGPEFADADPREAGAYLAARRQETAARELGQEEDYRRTLEKAEYTLGTVSREHIQSLYGQSLNLSASQVDKQAECRLSYFLDYGLRAKECREVTDDPTEFGNYVHHVLEHTARSVREMGGFHAVSLEQTLELAHTFSDEYARKRFDQLKSERLEYLFQRNLRELDMVVEELWQELSVSEFEPVGFEVAFGEASGSMPAIPIPNGEIPAVLRGKVDRVDVWAHPGRNYYRVVDYKTGQKDFDYCDIFNGVGLQMLLYLFALRENGAQMLGGQSIPAGVQYFPASATYISADGQQNEDEIREEREKKWKRKGLILHDRDVIHAMDPELKRMSIQEKNGELSGDLADRDQMKQLEAYVFRVLGRLVEGIASGNVEPNPYTRGSSHDACKYCLFGSICRRSAEVGRRNYKEMKPARFWEEVGKEMAHHDR